MAASCHVQETRLLRVTRGTEQRRTAEGRSLPSEQSSCSSHGSQEHPLGRVRRPWSPGSTSLYGVRRPRCPRTRQRCAEVAAASESAEDTVTTPAPGCSPMCCGTWNPVTAILRGHRPGTSSAQVRHCCGSIASRQKRLCHTGPKFRQSEPLRTPTCLKQS